MDVDTDAYVEADVDVYIDVCGIWMLWLEQGLTLVEGNGCPCWWYWVEVYDDDWLYVLSKLLCRFLECGFEILVCLIAGAIISFWGGMCEGGLTDGFVTVLVLVFVLVLVAVVGLW